ncbi:hypothetical protein TNCV_4012921 [Trichonephila clavipes]|nr:hypothetical protein TNCV_4012921 [Trichonephila clavipes]
MTCWAVLLEPQLLDIMIVQFRNEKVSNHGSIPITMDCNVVAFIVFEEGFQQPKKRTKQRCLRAYGLLRTHNPVSGKSLLDESAKLDYHAEGVLHGYWTGGGGLVGGALRHGIWLLRCVLENGIQRRERLPILDVEK